MSGEQLVGLHITHSARHESQILASVVEIADIIELLEDHAGPEIDALDEHKTAWNIVLAAMDGRVARRAAHYGRRVDRIRIELRRSPSGLRWMPMISSD